MDFAQYQQAAGETAVYPHAGEQHIDGLAYVALGLVGEAGEIANKVKKIIRDCGGVVEPERLTAIAEEAGDVLWYLARLCTEMGVDLGQVAALNAAKLESRALRGTLQGDGDNR
ncbi:nucleotide pyrophosphohydrolase [Streptomyces phage LazerLemon]|nr:nucleotide pyrophosphohydrolase [Streptomyces phage LazerLemon]